MSLSRRTLLRTAAAGAAALAGCAQPLPMRIDRDPGRLRLLGEAVLPHGMAFRDTTVGGLSGLDFDAASGSWVAICDDPSFRQAARFYTLAVDVSARSLRVAISGVTTLRDARGQPFPPQRNGGEAVDPESIRLLPAGRGFLWTSEGAPAINQHPALHESRLDGTYVRRFTRPKELEFGQTPDVGARPNRAFEGLALTPDARTAWVSMEGALLQDGPLPSVGAPGGPCRITAFDVASGRAVRQIAYLPDAIPVAPIAPGTADNGISEILMIDATRMLVLERAFAPGVGTSLRLYEIDTAAAGDTLGQRRLRRGGFQPAAKRLVADFAQLGIARTDNTEGLCWGPRLPDGTRTLLAVSDDNFRSSQLTQFLAFEYRDPP